MPRAFVVLNPVAGRSDPEHLEELLEPYTAHEGWEIHHTAADEDIGQVVRDALEQSFDLFIAAGGDGTISGIIDGLAETAVPLGILPIGTGNALARELDIPLDPEDALALITGDHTITQIDAIRVDARYFILGVGVGISSLTMRDTERAQKRQLGRLAYFWTGFKKLFGFQPQHFTLEIDGRHREIQASEITVTNIRAIGGSAFQWGPEIRLTDGQVNVCIVRAKSILDYLRIALELVLSQRGWDPNVRCIRARDRIRIDADRRLPIQADGDFIGQSPVEMEVVASAVPIIVP